MTYHSILCASWNAISFLNTFTEKMLLQYNMDVKKKYGSNLFTTEKQL